MTDDQIRLYVECRVRVYGEDRIRTQIVVDDEGRRHLQAKTFGGSQPPRRVSIELVPGQEIHPLAYQAAAAKLAAVYDPLRLMTVKVR